jgi:uncharacterized protein (TIRG00374 family)
MKPIVKKSVVFTVRWGIAVLGVWYVLAHMALRDRVRVFYPQVAAAPMLVPLADSDAKEDQPVYTVRDQNKKVEIPREQTANPPDRKTIQLKSIPKPVTLWGVDLEGDLNAKPQVRRLLIQDPGSGLPVWHSIDDAQDGYKVRIPYPRLDVGINRMIHNANPWLLWLSVLIFPITMVLTAYRWHELLKAIDIQIGVGRAFVLNMVGAFYSTFMLGSTGGDVLKAYYASRVTPYRTRAAMSVIIDRILGLLALIILGGAMAAMQWNDNPQCRKIALGCALIMLCVALGLLVFYNRTLHRLSGLDFLIKRLPMQKQVQNALEVMEIYRTRPMLVLWAVIVTFPVHITVIISAYLACKSFGLQMGWLYYWAIVPVIVLSGALPISPQGAGVMEGCAILLTRARGLTVSQAVALTMSIRMVQIIWNMSGGIFVVRGGFHRPSDGEKTDEKVAEEKIGT